MAVPCLVLAILAGGCGREVEMFPNPDSPRESAQVIRTADSGCVVAGFSSFPFKPGTPPDGVRSALLQMAGRQPCSAAAFYYSEREAAQRWVREQLELRRRMGRPPRLILVGHGLGATEATDAAWEILAREQDVQIVLLLTVDAVKAGRMSQAAGAAGAMVNRLPGVNTSLAAHDAAPQPDGVRLWAHINYYQEGSASYHGTSMPGAENRLLDDWTGLVNHGNADEFALPFLIADLRFALERGAR